MNASNRTALGDALCSGLIIFAYVAIQVFDAQPSRYLFVHILRILTQPSRSILVEREFQPLLKFAEPVSLTEIVIIENVSQENVECLASRAPILCANRQSVPKFFGFSIERVLEGCGRLCTKLPKVESFEEFTCVRHNVGCSLITKRGSANSNGRCACLNHFQE